MSADSRLCGEAALPAVLERLAYFEAPAQARETDLLPSRLLDYDPDPAWLDRFCLSGRGMATAPTRHARRGRRGHAPATPALAAWHAPVLSGAAHAARRAGATAWEPVMG